MSELDFYFDFYSPYAYLGFHRLMLSADKHAIAPKFHPVDLRRLKKAVGNTGPANVDIPLKIKYLMRDLSKWADRYSIPFGSVPKGTDSGRMNRGVFLARETGQEREYIAEGYSLVWGRGEDMGSDDVLASLACSLEWNPDTLLSFVDSEDACGKYEQTFDQAIANGVFGVPTVMIGGEMWWGNDRMFMVEEALTGHQVSEG